MRCSALNGHVRPRGNAPALLGLGAGLAVALALPGSPLAAPQAAQAQGTPGLMEFRWDNAKDYRKLYFFQSDTQRLKVSDYYLILKPKDRKTAILKLTVSLPKSFDAKIDPSRVKLCQMSEGGMLQRTRCDKQIPATVEVNQAAGTIEVFPETPISDQQTIGVYMRIFNPFNIGMYQFNAMAQAPGDIPISTYLGSWLIQIDGNGSN
ncbi:MAG: DUF2808 domain-containing protein [Cyanobacteriota bacterium]|nr:DUF2808 domain-containing protein [Cyanobacteriota bacterium]